MLFTPTSSDSSFTDLPDDETKYKASHKATIAMLSDEWRALSPEERREIAEETAKELAAMKKEKNKTTTKNVPLEAAVDADNTLKKIRAEVSLLCSPSFSPKLMVSWAA